MKAAKHYGIRGGRTVSRQSTDFNVKRKINDFSRAKLLTRNSLLGLWILLGPFRRLDDGELLVEELFGVEVGDPVVICSCSCR
jgi:hypothetical protein